MGHLPALIQDLALILIAGAITTLISLGVISDFLFPIAVGVSAITTFTTPYLIKFSEPLYYLLEKMLPEKWVRSLSRYSAGTQNIQAESAWKTVLKSYATIVVTNGIIILALMYVSFEVFMPFLQTTFNNDITRNVIGLVVSLSVAAPFLWALMAKRPNILAYKELWLERKYSRGPLLLVEILRIVVGILLIAFWVFGLFSSELAILVAVPIIIVVLIIFGKRIQTFYQRIEVRFLTNLNARETAAENTLSANVSRKSASIQSDLVPWDVHIVELEVSPQAAHIGKTLADLAWREKYGINIVYIKRGEKLIHVPGRNAIILPFDHVGIIATDDQMQIFKPIFDNTENGDGAPIDIDEIALKKIVVDEHTKLNGMNIRSSGLRERTNGLVIGIQRNNERILNPDSSVVFQWGDIVWIVGERKKIKKLTGL